MEANHSLCIVHYALCIMFAAAAASAATSADIERAAGKKMELDGRAAAAPEYLKAAELRVAEAKTLFPEKAADDLSLDEMVGVGEEAEIIAGANKALDARESDARALHYLSTAIDFDYGGKPVVADEWFSRALSMAGISADAKSKIEREKARIDKERDPTEYDPKPYVATPRFKKRDDIRAQIDAASTPDRLAELWSQYGNACFHCFDPDGMREARDKIAALKKRPGNNAPMWLRAIRAYDGLKVFPRPEKETTSPKDLAAMGVKETHTAIAGELDWDPEDATACIREAIESGATTIVLEDRGSPWYVQTIKPKSNQRIVLKKGVKILMDKVSAQLKSGAPMFDISGVSNVIIEGEGGPEDVYVGKFTSLAERNEKSKDYGGSGIVFSGASNIVVRNITFGANTMDGAHLTGIGANTMDIYLENVVLRDNYRQAMSVCNVLGLYCRNVSFLSTGGNDPMCGIDFESSCESEATSETYFLDCTFADNAGAAIMFSQSSFYPVTALFRRCKFLASRNYEQITIFARCGVYMGQNAKAPSKIVFDDCDMETPCGNAPVTIANSTLFDVEFHNFRLKEANRENRKTWANPPVRIELNREYRYYFNWKDWDVANEGSLLFDNFTVDGYDNAPPLRVRDHTGGYSVPNISGTMVFNGKTIDMSQYVYRAPETAMGLVEIPKFDPADYIPPAKNAKADTPAAIPVSFGLQWPRSWFSPEPTYRVLYADGGEWKMKRFLPGTVEMDLAGKPVAYYCRSGESKAVVGSRKKGEPATVYFEVPAGDGECVVKVIAGDSALRNPAGETAGETKWLDLLTCAHYFKIPRKPDKSEVWSLSFPTGGCFKFFAPMNGVFAESPESLPRRRP